MGRYWLKWKMEIITKPSPNNQGNAQQTRLIMTTGLRRCAEVSCFRFHASMEIKVEERSRGIEYPFGR